MFPSIINRKTRPSYTFLFGANNAFVLTLIKIDTNTILAMVKNSMRLPSKTTAGQMQ